MRIEDVGSLSPSGDLLAFLLAIVLTVSVLSTFYTPTAVVDHRDDPVSIINVLTASRLLDRDGDTLLEFPDEIDLNGSMLPVMDGLDILIKIYLGNDSICFTIRDGVCFIENNFSMNSTIIYSWVFPFEFEDLILPGRISFTFLEGY